MSDSLRSADPHAATLSIESPSVESPSVESPGLFRATRLAHRADLRGLFWAVGLFPLPTVVTLATPAAWPWVLPFAIYLSFCAGVLSHYHNHRGVFVSRGTNRIYSCWLSVFYGFPLFAWVPTHNQNHHKFVNGPHDATRTERAGADGLLTAIIYPFRSSAWQVEGLVTYLKKQWRKGGYAAWEAPLQSVAIVVFHGCVAWSSWELGGWLGVRAYLGLVLLPALFAPWSMMFINYLQHVGCDHESTTDHSRNFVGSWENWLVFDAGLHTVHHDHPGTHWSRYRDLHRAKVSSIDPALCERNVFSFLIRRYFRKSKLSR